MILRGCGRLHQPWWRIAWLVVGCTLGHQNDAQAQPNIWQRVKLEHEATEEATLRAVQHVLQGRGEELDLLHVRAAIVELLRDQIRTPHTVVLLFHLRRQLGLSPQLGGIERLATVISPRLSAYYRALAYYELARLRLDPLWTELENGPKRAGEVDRLLALDDLGRALLDAWEPEMRSEILLYRGMSLFKLERYDEAARDFERSLVFSQDDSIKQDAQLGLALVHYLRGDFIQAVRAARSALPAHGRAIRASDAMAFKDFPLVEAERITVELFLRGAKRTQKGGQSSLALADVDDCASLALVLPRLGGPFLSLARQLGPECASWTAAADAQEKLDQTAQGD